MRAFPGRSMLVALLAAVLAAAGLVTGAPAAVALGNGLAKTPPMGWNDWNSFGCNVTEALVEQTADYFVSSGLKNAGYTYVNIDDCWMTHSRDAGGHLVPDPAKFPDGIKGTADYVHARGLKLGIYEDAGTATCAGYPGSLGHEQTDANSFASWGIDYLKYDNCNNNGSSTQADYVHRYTAMRDALAATGRPIVYSICEWGDFNPASWAGDVGNLWRTTGDINASWGSLQSIYHQNVGLAGAAKPGAWNDPDMLEVGNGMSFTEDRSEFSLWAGMAAPLLAGTDFRTATPATLSVYLNADVVGVDQDTLGRQGTQVSAAGGLDVLAKPLAGGDVAVVLFNENGGAQQVSTSAAAVGLPAASSYRLKNLWSKEITTSSGAISASVPAHGTVMYRITPNASGTSIGTTHPLVGASSGRCADVYDNQTAPGTKVEIWDCGGGANQAWTLTAAGELRVYGGTQCLDTKGASASGAAVELWTCNGGANQKFKLNADGTITQGSVCLDVFGGDKPAGNVNGSPLELWTCNGGANQQWALR